MGCTREKLFTGDTIMKMQVILILTLVLWISIAMPAESTLAQTIQSAEYFIDDDPGIGKAMPLAPGDDTWGGKDEEAIMDIDTSVLSSGPHRLGVRFQQSNGTWSYTRTMWFRVTGEPILIGAEWFTDEDPGPGNGIPIGLPVDGIWDEAEEEVDLNAIDVSYLSINGPNDPNGHMVFVRFLDSDGNWGKTRQAQFQVAAELHLVAAEWTTDPLCPAGQGNEMQPADGTWDEPEEELVADVSFAQLDPYKRPTVYVRVQDNLGRWSTRGGWVLGEDNTWVFDPSLGWMPGSFIVVNPPADGP
jgi:hypothetical protein